MTYQLPIAARIERIPRVGSRLTDELAAAARRRGTGMLPLSAYPSHPLPEAIRAAAARGLKVGAHPPSVGLLELREAIADRLAGEVGWRPDPESEVLVTAGAMHALQLALLTTLDPGAEVLYFTPSFFFGGLIELCGGVPRPAPCDPRQAFPLPVERLAAFPRARVLILNAPVNPTGVVPDAATLGAIAAWAKTTGGVVISDESYDKLVYDGRRHTSFFATRMGRECGLLVRSFTKSYGLPQWRVGYLVGPAPAIRAARKALEWTNLFGPYLNQKVAALVLRSGAGWLADVTARFQRNRDALVGILRASPRLAVTSPGGNPFVFVKVAGLGKEDVRFSRRLIESHGVPNTPGTYHGLSGWLRIPFGGETRDVMEAGRRVVAAVDKFEPRG